jgi:hypothetical protein
VYSRNVGAGCTLSFGVSGKLWKNAQVMYDRETNSLWSHLTGEAIRGPLKGARLTRLAATPHITWAAWRNLYPATLVLSVNGNEDLRYDIHEDYHADPNRVGMFPIARPDRRAKPKEVVLGVAVGTASSAYLHSFLEKRRLLADTVGGTPILVWFDPATRASAVYARPRAGSDFRLGNLHGGDTIIGPAGQRWQAATGRARFVGPDLRPLPHTNGYWFGWSAFYPRTRLRKGL